MLGIVATLLFPLLRAAGRDRVQRAWCRGVLGALGVRTRLEGELPRGPALLVSNHVSWLDVIALSAVRPAVFVCKDEVAAWPLIGRLLRGAGTVFIRRGSARAAGRAVGEIAAALRSGRLVAVFPEGTTTDGTDVLPFQPALLQAATDAGCEVQPVAIAYSSDAAVYAGETRFVDSLRRIAGARGLEVTLSLLPRLPASIARREAAILARRRILSRVRHETFAAPSHSRPTLRAA